MTCKTLAALGMAAAATLGSPTGAAAQAYPDRAVRMIIAFPAGGTIDTLGRIVAQKLSEAWGQNVVVENRAGASGNIGAQAAAQAAPDGYSLHLGAQTLAVNVTLAPTKGFDPTTDLEPIMLVATAQDVMMVPPDSPFRSARELIDYAKANPGQLNYASLGTGTSGHLASTLFSDLAGVKLQHVPYSQYSQALTDFLSGRTALWITTLGGAIGNIQAGSAGGVRPGARQAASRRSDLQGAGRRLLGRVELVRAVRPQGDVEGDHRQGQRRHGPRHRAARREGAGSDHGLSVHRRLARQARRLPQERDRQVGRGGEERVAKTVSPYRLKKHQ